MGARLDPIPLLDAAYAIDASEDEWVEGIFRAAESTLDHGRGMYAFSYDASRDAKLRLGPILERNVARPISNTDEGRALLSSVDPKFVEATYRSQTCALASERWEFVNPADAPRKYLESFGISDVLVINARDPTGRGWVFGGYLPTFGDLSDRERLGWSKIAAHIGAANRLRRRLERVADARLTPEGELEDGEPEATIAREALRDAVVSYERAHALATKAPDEALRDWRVLVDARWSLVDGFERDGTRYVVARRNESEARGPEALTTRERQVLNLAVIGQTNKLIAYELGITHATVRVLISRAAAKLGATSRDALVRMYKLALDPE